MEQRKLQDQAHQLVDYAKMQVKFSDTEAGFYWQLFDIQIRFVRKFWRFCTLGEVREDQKTNIDQNTVRMDNLEDRMKNIEDLLLKLVEIQTQNSLNNPPLQTISLIPTKTISLYSNGAIINGTRNDN